MDDLWRPVAGIDGTYEVSRDGVVRNTANNRVRKPTLTSHRYYVHMMRVGGKPKLKYVHDIVAAAFIGPKAAGMTVNHINGFKTDNRLCNLEYLTNAENVSHAHRTGLCNNRGSNHGYSKLSEIEVYGIREAVSQGKNDAETGRSYGVSTETVRRIRLRRTWRHI